MIQLLCTENQPDLSVSPFVFFCQCQCQYVTDSLKHICVWGRLSVMSLQFCKWSEEKSQVTACCSVLSTAQMAPVSSLCHSVSNNLFFYCCLGLLRITSREVTAKWIYAHSLFLCCMKSKNHFHQRENNAAFLFLPGLRFNSLVSMNYSSLIIDFMLSQYRSH